MRGIFAAGSPPGNLLQRLLRSLPVLSTLSSVPCWRERRPRQPRCSALFQCAAPRITTDTHARYVGAPHFRD